MVCSLTFSSASELPLHWLRSCRRTHFRRFRVDDTLRHVLWLNSRHVLHGEQTQSKISCFCVLCLLVSKATQAYQARKQPSASMWQCWQDLLTVVRGLYKDFRAYLAFASSFQLFLTAVEQKRTSWIYVFISWILRFISCIHFVFVFICHFVFVFIRYTPCTTSVACTITASCIYLCCIVLYYYNYVRINQWSWPWAHNRKEHITQY